MKLTWTGLFYTSNVYQKKFPSLIRFKTLYVIKEAARQECQQEVRW